MLYVSQLKIKQQIKILRISKTSLMETSILTFL